MPDPVEIIAETILKPPPQDGRYDENFAWQYGTMMALPAAPDHVRHVAEAAVQALADAGLITPPPVPHGALPSPAQMRTWLACHQWRQGGEGSAGAMWFPPVRGRGVGIPDDGSDPDLIAGAIARIADRELMTSDQVAREMLTFDG